MTLDNLKRLGTLVFQDVTNKMDQQQNRILLRVIKTYKEGIFFDTYQTLLCFLFKIAKQTKNKRFENFREISSKQMHSLLTSAIKIMTLRRFYKMTIRLKLQICRDQPSSCGFVSLIECHIECHIDCHIECRSECH